MRFDIKLAIYGMIIIIYASIELLRSILQRWNSLFEKYIKIHTHILAIIYF